MASIPPVKFRRSFRGNIKFVLPAPHDDPESDGHIRYLKLSSSGDKGPSNQTKLILEESLSDEEREKGLFHFMEFQTGKKSSKQQTYYCINCQDHRFEVQGIHLKLIPSPQPSGPKCRSETPCRAMFERRKDGNVTQLHCVGTTEISQHLAFGLQLKGLLKKSWKPGLIPGERAVFSRHVMDFELEPVKPKDEPKSNMSFLSVPM